jgi:hypothetical protein
MLTRKYIEQDPKGSLFKVVALLKSVATIPPSKDLVLGFDDRLEGPDVLTIGMNKKNWQVIQHKACRAIVSKAHKIAIERKNKRLKPYCVTCDSSIKPKAPHINIWVNMLYGHYGLLDPSLDNINAQPHVLMNTVKSKMEDQWEYVGYDLSY